MSINYQYKNTQLPLNPSNPLGLVKLANSVLIMLGAETIDDLDDESTEGRVVKELIYESYSDALSSHRWRFATQREDLVQVVQAQETLDITEGNAFLIPDDMLYLSKCSSNDWEIIGDLLYSQDQEVQIEYTKAVDYSLCPAYFVSFMKLKFASEIAIPITDSTSRAQLFYQAKGDKERIAKHLDSTQRIPDQITDTPLIDIRY